jgi:hypothetical protein
MCLEREKRESWEIWEASRQIRDLCVRVETAKKELWDSVSPRLSWLPEPGLSSHEPMPELSVSWVYFSPGPAYREFASASALVFRVCFGLGLLSSVPAPS